MNSQNASPNSLFPHNLTDAEFLAMCRGLAIDFTPLVDIALANGAVLPAPESVSEPVIRHITPRQLEAHLQRFAEKK